MEEEVYFTSDGHRIEALLEEKDLRRGLIITHPHPLYGGDMHNPVVDITRQAFGQQGFTTLRFNFRGTGRSQGRFDQGAGEQQDVLAAIAFLQDRKAEHIELAGYSFGAWVNALTDIESTACRHMLMISPPVGFIDFDNVTALPELERVITGELDDIAPFEQIQTLMPVWNRQAKLEIIPGADHFYTRAYRSLADAVGRYAAGLAG
jgi:alpha/beta superfamily hydrolase